MNARAAGGWRLEATRKPCRSAAATCASTARLAGLYNVTSGGKTRAASAEGLEASAPSVARWLGDIREFFPTPVVQVIQRDAFERLGLKQMLLEPEFLATVEADVHLVADLISLRSVMPAKTMETAREVVAKVVRELLAKLESPHGRDAARRAQQIPAHVPAALRRYRLAAHHRQEPAALAGGV